MINIERMLVLGTGHLTPHTCNTWLRNNYTGVLIERSDIGWILWVDEDAFDEDLPADLLVCFELAREYECEWVNFDKDAPAIDELPLYDW